MLKKGPANIKDVLKTNSASNKWIDKDWSGNSTYVDTYTSSTDKTAFDNGFKNYGYYFGNVRSVFPNANIFDADGNPEFTEPRQGGIGDCYFIQSVSGVAEFPQLIRNLFLTTSFNDAGIIGVQFFIRGKPWVVTIDEQFLLNTQLSSKLVAANIDVNNEALWVPIIEKAWAKVKGNYYRAGGGGFGVEGIRALTGAPGFSYTNSKIDTSGNPTLAETFTAMKNANSLKYIMSAGTSAGSDTTYNSCGIPFGHAYSIVEAFTLTDASGTTQSMIMARNPWGSSAGVYNGTWNNADSLWTTATVAQVPLGIDPRTANQNGTFIMPIAQFKTCFSDYQIIEYRASEGYENTWYDADGIASGINYYFVTADSNTGDLYFGVESYYQQMLPAQCTTGNYVDPQSGTTASETMLTIYTQMSTDGGASYSNTQYYYDQYLKPTVIRTSAYTAGAQFKYKVIINFMTDYPVQDYTVTLYSKQKFPIKNAQGKTNQIYYDGRQPSGFTGSSYCGNYCVLSEMDNYENKYGKESTWRNGMKYTGPPQKSASLVELFQSAGDISTFFSVIGSNPMLLLVWFKLW